MAALTEEQRRAVTALADVAWAYGEATAAGDTARASQLLALFQALYSGYRSALLASYPEAQQASVDGALPRTLTVDAIYGPQTRLAMIAVFAVAFGERVRPALGTIPNTAGQFGAWFTSALKPVAPSFGTVWDRAQEVPPMDLAEVVGGELDAYVLGLEEPPPAAERRNLIDPRFSYSAAVSNFTRTMHTSVPPQPGAANTVVQSAPLAPVAKKRFTIPTWGWIALGLSGAAAVGFVAWRASR